jgi:hypothetical protein
MPIFQRAVKKIFVGLLKFQNILKIQGKMVPKRNGVQLLERRYG